ncbi:MAG: aminotransferase class III-fold pyridoxal phosphate-dependent enzyme [Candidatus Ozemobacteraceae bacterium]
MSKKHLDKLHAIRKAAGPVKTIGLDDKAIADFLAHDKDLARAIDAAVVTREQLAAIHPNLFKMDETALCRHVQERILNFYPPQGINFYLPLAAKGPWIVTSHGAVLHDSGGYGMLGLGHAPDVVLEAMSAPYAMANVMTPSFSQKNLTDRLVREIGHTRKSCPFHRFVFLNSGSEAVTFTCRVTDIHARKMTEVGERAAGRKIARLAILEGFHGRTEGPARLSDSTRKAYSTHLASFKHPDNLVFLPVNDLAALRKAFEKAEKDGTFYEAFYVEPVMGEGVPGLALTREYYDEARALTRKAGTLFIVDSIQAAIRAQGCLSIIDYPGFESCEPPDMETYSKAVNAGQFPMSVVAMTKEVSDTYVCGLYGNTMTTNPRACEVACAVLDGINDKMRKNIRERGKEFLEKFEKLAGEFPGTIDRVVGSGLMVCAMLNPKLYRVTGAGGFEEFLRTNGIEMIHGGDFGLRFTPPFNITSAEIDLIVNVIRKGLQELSPGISRCL